MPQPFSGGRPRIAVVGAGFGGLQAARTLARRPVDVVLVDRNNYHCFQPLLYQVATAGLEPDAIAHPVRAIVRRASNVRFVMTSVQSVDLQNHTLRTDNGPVEWDYLVLAAGSVTNFFNMESVRSRAFELKDIDHAVDLRNHVLTLFERAANVADPRVRGALLTFCVVGGGPTGVEFAGALSELVRLVLVRDYPGLDLSSIRILLLESGDDILQTFPKPLRDSAVRALEEKGVQIAFGSRVVGQDEGQVLLADGATVPCHTLLWAAGVRANPLADTLGVPLARMGRVAVEPTLQLAGHPRVFVVGDMALLEVAGTPLPMVAPTAIQQGRHAGRNILALIEGRPPGPFLFRDPGNLATIGRNAAVAQIGRFRLTGFVAWFVWLVVHLMNLVGFRNRLLCLINWAWDYFFYDRAVRLITRREEPRV
jgi:NADH dehydrogenase